MLENLAAEALREFFSTPLFEQINFGLVQAAGASPESTVASMGPGFGDYIKWISIVVTVILAWGFWTVFKKKKKVFRGLSQEAVYKPPATQAIRGQGYVARWEEVLKHIDSVKESDWKIAIIEGDKLADEVLKRSGYEGDTMGDRLMGMTRSDLNSLDDLWVAHKIRNKIAHEPRYVMTYKTAREAVRIFEKVLKELGAV